MGDLSVQHTHRNNSGNGEERMGSERLKQFLTNEPCVGESNSVRESEADIRIEDPSHFC